LANCSYRKDRTALLFIDPYNDFLSEGGKLWPMVEGVAREVGLLNNLRAITAAIRKAAIQVFIVSYYAPSLFGLKGDPVLVTVPRPASDEGAARRLWDVSEKLTGVQWLAEERSRAAPVMR